MSERTLKISLGVVTTIAIAGGGAAIRTYFDVQHMKEQLAKGISGERIATIEGELRTHELAGGIRASAFEQRFSTLEGRVQSLERSREWQRNQQDRSR